MHVPDWLARRAALHPDRPALIAAEGSYSFAELHRWADELASLLASAGASHGDRVALLAGNSAAFAAVVHAVPRAGVVLVPLNTRLSAEELRWQLADCGAALLLHDQAHTELAASLAAGGVRPLEVSPQPSLPQASRFSPFFASLAIDLDAPHTIIYTSGTTGRPKGAVLTAGNHWWSATASALNLGLQEHDRWLAVLPLFHVGGLSILLRGAIYGMPVVIHSRFDAAAALTAIDDGATIVSVVAVMLQRMLEARGERSGAKRLRPFPPHFRCALLGGGPAPLPLLEACAARGVPVVQTYGMTETASQAVTLAPADALRKLGSAGLPLLPMELQIEREGRPAVSGQVGEICLRGPMVTAGYHGRPAATAEAISEGWLHTGDLGYLDAEGYLYVVDRRTDLIISGGENVYPAEVEAALLAHPAVAEAGVVGAPDERWGQVPVAFVVARGLEAASLATTANRRNEVARQRLPPTDSQPTVGQPPTEAALIAFCRERLAAYKAPRRVIFVAELPRTASGKLRRAELRTLLGHTG